MKTAIFLLLCSFLSTATLSQTIRYVQPGGTGDGSSWAMASSDLQAMINASSANDQVWVASGTYRPTTGTDRSISFSMKNGVAVYGGFAGTESMLGQRDWLSNITILSGDIGVPNVDSDNSLRVISNFSLNSTAVLDGFTIRDGRAVDGFPNSGAGMANYQASVTIRNCRFMSNKASLDGGGVLNNASSPIFTDCHFEGNSALNGNGGGAMFNEASSHPVITNCMFVGNYANQSGGAIFNSFAHPGLTNCIFIGNKAEVNGGAIYNLGSSSNGVIRNCSFSGNTAVSAGGAIMNDGQANVTISNCILWGNNSQIVNSASSPVVSFSLVQGGYSGTGNIHEDPLFLNQPPVGLGTTGDLHLLECSPAIDLGTNTGAPLTDFAGNMRPFNAIGTPMASTDMGAFEFQSTFTVNPWYIDADADDYGSSVVFRCTPPPGAYALSDLSGTGTDDCNDNDNTIYPGAPELCDSKDNDCNGATNENDVCCPASGNILYVNANAAGQNNGNSWQDAFTNLQHALISTCPGITQIWVAAGTYKPTAGTDRSISFVMKNNLAIYGGFSGTENSLSQRNWSDNVTVLSGNIGLQESNTDNSFHVIANSGLNSTAILDGFTITLGYSSVDQGRGAGMFNVGSSPTIVNCSFVSNGTSGTGSGGGMSNQSNSAPTVTNCKFIGNLAEFGGGLFNDAGCSPILNACVFSGNYGNTGGGIYNYTAAPVVTNCLITGHNSIRGAAVYNLGGSAQFINCTFSGNSSALTGVIFSEGGGGPGLKNCIIWGNSSAFTNGNGSISTVTYSIVQGGHTGTGNLSTDPLFVGSGDFSLQVCSPAIDAGTNTGAPATDLDGGVRPFNATGAPVAMTDMGAFEYSFLVPLVTCYADTDGDGFGNPNASQAFCISCGAGYISNNTDCNDMSASQYPGATEICDGIDNDCDGMTDEEAANGPFVLYVKANATGLNNGTSWANAYTSLQSALSNPCPMVTQIWVAAGTYVPTTGSDRSVSFAMKNNVSIYGGFVGMETTLSQRNWSVNVTTLSGNIGQTGSNADNSYHVLANTNLNTTAVLDGFTITLGNADGSGPQGKGGGMYNVQSSPTIVNCLFISNEANGPESGGGMFNENNSSPVISNCTFTANWGAFGGGMYNASGCSPQLNGCVFSTNYGNYGGGILNSFASPVLTNCLFTGHTSIFQAAAALNFGGSAQFINCTFAGNAGIVDGAIHNDAGATPVVKNCIVWGNSAGITNSVPAMATVTYSIVQGGYTGTGNLNVDPLFVGSGDLHLQACSPAIDAGINSGAPSADIEDNARPFNATGTPTATTDMGAYEYSSVVVITCYPDADVDGYGDPGSNQEFCQSCGTGFVSNNADCDDTNPSSHPAATEICDGVDNDCDGLIDEDNVCCTSANVLFVKADASGNNNGTTWEHAYTSLQSALNNTCPAITQIWVAAGTYKPTTGTDRTISFVMKNSIAIYGGFAGDETELNQRDLVSNITILSGEIASPSNEDNSYHVVSNYGNGLNTTAILDGFTITGGNANSGDFPDFFGGGMLNYQSAPSVSNCVFVNNRARQGAGMLNHSASPVISYVTFSGNSASLDGGGMYNVLANTTVSNCHFTSNSAVNDGGAIQNFTCNPTIVNCLITANWPSGITCLDLSQPAITNCTFSDNLYAVRSSFNSIPQLKNCILWDNIVQVQNNTGSNASITYSVVQGGYPGMGNLDIDPLFVSSTDRHLQQCSPAVDAGTNAGAPATDLDGNTRPFNDTADPDPVTDMGAFEYQASVLPVAACTSITVYLNAQNNFTVLATDINSGSTGCGPLTSLINGESLRTFYCDDLGENIMTLTVVDIYGRASSCTATVTVLETIAPTALCKDVTVYLDQNGDASVSAALVNDGSQDNCGIDIMSVAPNTFSCADIGSNTLTLTVVDLNGNAATCTSTVFVADIAAPTALCHDVTISLESDGTCSLTPVQVDQGSYDNCSIASMSVSPNTFDCGDVGMHSVILTVTDVNGNSASGSANVTVLDITPPIAVCQDITLHLDANGQAGFSSSETVFYDDSCDKSIAPFSNVSQTFVAATSGFITRVGAGIGSWMVPVAYSTMISTASGNENYGVLQYSGRCCYSWCAPGNNMAFADLPTAFYVNAGETVTISFSGSGGEMHYQNGQLRLYVTGITNALAVLDGGSSDVCGMDGLTASASTFSCTDVGENAITLTLTDVHGNSSTCSALVTVIDNSAPTAGSQDVTVYLDDDGNASVSAAQVDNGSYDNCSIESLSVWPNAFTCSNIGSNMVTLTVTDVSGNSATSSATVTVMVPPGLHHWLGIISSDWDNPQNWSRCSVPTSADDVRIEARQTKPVIGPFTNAYAKSVLLKDNMILTVQGTLLVFDE